MTLIGHDTIIGNNNFFAAQNAVGSGVEIGDMNFFGINSTVRNGLNIGNENIIGQKSNILKNIDNQGLFYGNPAKKAKQINNPIR